MAAAAFFFGRISGGGAVRENLPKNRYATRQAGKRAGRTRSAALSSLRVLQNEIAAAAHVAMESSLAGCTYPFKTVVPCVYVERESVGAPCVCES